MPPVATHRVTVATPQQAPTVHWAIHSDRLACNAARHVIHFTNVTTGNRMGACKSCCYGKQQHWQRISTVCWHSGESALHLHANRGSLVEVSAAQQAWRYCSTLNCGGICPSQTAPETSAAERAELASIRSAVHTASSRACSRIRVSRRLPCCVVISYLCPARLVA